MGNSNHSVALAVRLLVEAAEEEEDQFPSRGSLRTSRTHSSGGGERRHMPSCICTRGERGEREAAEAGEGKAPEAKKGGGREGLIGYQ